MKSCPTCLEQFEDEMAFCTFDGTPLRSPNGHTSMNSRPTPRSDEYPVPGESSNGWKIAFFLLLLIALACAGVFAYLSTRSKPLQNHVAAIQPASDQKTEEPERGTEVPVKPPSLLELSRRELMESLPKNLLRRFHLGDPGQGTPDDLRIIPGPKEELVVMIGSGRLEGSSRIPVERLLILKYEGDQFADATKQLLPSPYGSGVIRGRGAQVKFDDAGNNIRVREPASSSSIIQECTSCDHAYQVVTLEWKNGRYIESSRTWDNDRYTVFYVVAEALEKKRIDARARPFIDTALEPIISQGFPRNAKEGWIAEWRDDDDTETAKYELNNNTDRLTITLSRAKGDWKAIQIQ